MLYVGFYLVFTKLGLLMSLKKWMVALATVLATTQLTPASAQNCGSYECETDCGFSLCDCDPCDGWSIYADWLYWNTRKCDLDFAFKSDGSSVIESLHSVCPSWDSGFRIGVLKECGDAYFGVHYTRYCNDSSNHLLDESDGYIRRSQIGSEFSATVDDAIEYAAGSYKLELNQLDFELGFNLDFSDCLDARAFTGFRWASINQKYGVIYATEYNDQIGEEEGHAVDLIAKNNDMDFYGLYLGSNASYTICDCFDLFGGFSFGIGAAEFSRGYYHTFTLGGHELVNDVSLSTDCWRVVSVMDFNVGLTYHLSNCLCADWAFSVGYEFHNWLDAQDFIGFHAGDDSGELHLDRHTENLGFDGLFVRVSAAF